LQRLEMDCACDNDKPLLPNELVLMVIVFLF
jgi:hypothetical protein